MNIRITCTSSQKWHIQRGVPREGIASWTFHPSEAWHKGLSTSKSLWICFGNGDFLSARTRSLQARDHRGNMGLAIYCKHAENKAMKSLSRGGQGCRYLETGPEGSAPVNTSVPCMGNFRMGTGTIAGCFSTPSHGLAQGPQRAAKYLVLDQSRSWD